MRQLFFCSLFFSLSFASFSQVDSLKKNSDGKYEISAVINVDSVSANDLYSRAKKFVAINFVSGKSVTQLNDDISKTVIGNGVTKVSVDVGFGSDVLTDVDYTFTIQCKDSRYKVSISDFFFHNSDVTRVRLEDDYWTKKKITRKWLPIIKGQIELQMDALIQLLKKSMAVDQSKDW